MNRRSVLLTGAATLCTRFTTAPIAAQPTAGNMAIDEILASNLKASGGAAAYKKASSRIARGTIEMPAMGIKSDIQIYSKAPNKFLMLFTMPGFGEIAEGFDGTAAWSKNPAQGVRVKSGAELERTRLTSDFYRALKLRELYPQMELLPEEAVNGKPAFVVKATPKSGIAETWYIDKATFHMVRLHTEIDGPQGRVPMDSYMEEFRDVDGMAMPFRIRQSAGPMNMTITLTAIENNAVIDDARFAKPAN
jgi:hypothetical protein